MNGLSESTVVQTTAAKKRTGPPAPLEPETDFSRNGLHNSSRNNTARLTTASDSVRSYLTEIGRVPLLRQDEEISEARKVQRYMQVLAVRTLAAKRGDRQIQRYEFLLDARRGLQGRLRRPPSHEQWAREAGTSPDCLRRDLQNGRDCWAQHVGITSLEIETIERDGRQAKERLMRANLRLVVSIAKKYQNRGLDLLDLIQEGTLGLERAIEKFDPTKGFRFSTYAYWWIRQGVNRALASQSRTIRVPVHVLEKLGKIRQAQRHLLQIAGKTPELGDIARQTGLDPAEVSDILSCLPRVTSLEQKVGNERESELSDFIEASTSETPEMRLTRQLLSQDLRALLLELSDREREVIELRYGMGPQSPQPASLAEAGRHLGISRERVRQIEARALQKLKRPKNRERVRGYLETFG